VGKDKGRRLKRPRQTLHPSVVKEARSEFRSSMQDKPAWRVSFLQLVDPFGWHAIGSEKAVEVRTKLGHFESMTWHQILTEGGGHNHPIPVGDLCKTARDRLEDLRLEDIDELVSLRLGGAERVWGIRNGNVMLLLWWDPEHAVCPSLKKHT
jgi:hypothetical protein